MSLIVKRIDYDIAVKFSKPERNLIIKEKYEYFGLFDGEILLSIMGCNKNGNSAKFHAFYTPIEHRGKHYFSTLFTQVFEIMSNDGITVFTMDCLDDSKGIAERMGFTLLREKQFKSFKIYYYHKDITKIKEK